MCRKSVFFIGGLFWILLLSACLPPFGPDIPNPSVDDIAFQDNTLWLCGLEHLDLTTNTFEKLDPKSYGCEHLFVAQNGWVWAYDKYGLQYCDGKTWRDSKVYDRDQGDLNAVTETRDGAIWVSSSILTRYDPRTDQATVIVPPQPTPTPKPEDQQDVDVLGSRSMPTKGYVGPVFEAADGSLWFNQPFHTMVHWNPTTNVKQIWGPNDGFDGFDPIPLKYLQAQNGDIWMGTDRGLYYFQNGKWRQGDHYGKAEQDIGNLVVKDMLEDSQGRLWVAYFRAGVKMKDGTTWREIGNYSDEQPLSLFEDSSGAVWIGFLRRGAVKYENERFKSYPTNIRTFYETPDHRLFGGGGEGLFLFNLATDEWEKYPPSK